MTKGRGGAIVFFRSWLVIFMLGVIPAEAGAQESIRVVEAVRASTGERQRYVIRDLDSGEIRALQSALRKAGYVGIGWTGRLDDGTLHGLTRFQQERGLVECGCVSYETVVALGLRPEVVATVAVDPGERSGASTTDAYSGGSALQSGVVYPLGIPIYIPRPPPCEDEPCEGEGPGDEGEGGDAPEPEDSWIVIGDAPAASDARTPARGGTGSVASPPGVRPAPPADARAPTSGSPH